MCDNINNWGNGLFDDRAYSYFVTCHYVIRGFRDENYNEEETCDLFWIHTRCMHKFFPVFW